MSNRRKADIINLIYKVTNSLSDGKARIEKDALWHQYDVNKYSLRIHTGHASKLKTDMAKALMDKLGLVENADPMFKEYTFLVPVNGSGEYIVLRLARDQDKKEYVYASVGS